jgi:hypothetical protein
LNLATPVGNYHLAETDANLRSPNHLRPGN